MVPQNVIDLFVGRKLYNIRQQAGRSRVEVATAIGVQPEKLREFETGAERIPAAVLLQLSEVLHCDVREFFKGLVHGELAVDASVAVMSETTEETEVATLVNNFARIHDKKARTVILSLVAAYVENENSRKR